MFLLCDLKQIFLEFQNLQRRTIVNFDDCIIGQLFMLCQFLFPVLFNDIPYFLHSFEHKHMSMGNIVFDAIFIFIDQNIILFMLCQFLFPVLFNDIPYFLHSFEHKHMSMGNIVFDAIFIFIDQNIIFLIQRINGIQQSCKMIIERSSPYKCITVCIGFYFGSINKKRF